MTSEEIHTVLRAVWNRDISADDAFDHLNDRLRTEIPSIGKVLDAADELVSACQEECVEPRFLEETRLFEAVREWRKTWKRQPNSNPR